MSQSVLDVPAEQIAPDDLIDTVRWDDRGLVPCITQARDGAVLMLAWMNAESLRRTIDQGTMWYWSRSRAEMWHKGATSGNTQKLLSLRVDCDGDTLLAIVDQHGSGACHVPGQLSCFHRQAALGAAAPQPAQSSSEPERRDPQSADPQPRGDR